jgi:hypothetical protein
MAARRGGVYHFDHDEAIQPQGACELMSSMPPTRAPAVIFAWSWTAAAVTLVIAAATFGSAACMNDREQGPVAAAADDHQSPSAGLPSPVEGYIQFAATADDPQSGLSDDRIAEGLRKLAGALGTLNAGRPDLLVDLRVAAEHFLLNPASTQTAAMIQEALVAAADAIERGGERDPALRGAAESVRPDRPLTEQRAAVLYFFQRAADAIGRRPPDS